MLHSKESTLSFLRGNNFPDVFIDLFEGNDLPENFDILFGIPEELYRCSKAEQLEIISNNYQPLWDDGNFDAIYCLQRSTDKIVKVYVEGGLQEYARYTHFAANVLFEVWEMEWDEHLEEYAHALKFPHLESLLSFLNQHQDDVFSDGFELLLNQFIDKLASI